LQKDRLDKILGCILGGALGDALGGPYEGRQPPVQIDHQSDWRISDDTQLTLATCEAIAQTGRVDPKTIAAQMAAWFQKGRISGIGASTHAALSALVMGGHWALVGMRGERAAGNGAAMRIAPLAFFLDPENSSDRQLIRDVCRITHHNDEAYLGALSIMIAIRSAWNGTWRGQSDLLIRVVNSLPDSRLRDRFQDIIRFGPQTTICAIAAQFGNSGYVVDSVPLALLGVQNLSSRGFSEMLEQLIALGGDTDSIASMAGQIGGTALGANELPAKMLARLPELKIITAIAEQLAKIVPL
jgi:ADP-ribosyl-[dinitrogen reductase] hydrolase